MDTIQKPHASPKDFFINLGVIALTYFIVANMLSLIFNAIDFKFPASLNAGSYIPDISFALSALIIGFPMLLVLSKMLAKGESMEPAKRELPVRKWLAYLTLFIAGIVVIGDLIALLSTFLRGDDITTAFLLKVLAVFVVAGVTFAYYFVDLRYTGNLPLKTWIAIKATVLVCLTVVFGFYVFGSPATQRAMRFDSQRVSDLQNIQSQALIYWQNKKTVPGSLTELNDPLSYFEAPRDPRTNAEYVYEKVSATSFKICATFEREGRNVGSLETKAIPVPRGTAGVPEYWGHDAGDVCFERTIDPERYSLKGRDF